MPRNALDRYEHLVAFALDQAWAITPSMLSLLAGILARRIAGDDDPSPEDLQHMALVQQDRLAHPTAPAGSGIAVLPVHGTIMPRANLFSESSGGTTFERLGNDLTDAAADPNVGTIVLDVDSPGGSVAGAPEFAQAVRDATQQKRVITVAHPGMNSAAFWVGTQAHEVIASPSALVGGLGVYMIHNDLSKALEHRGINRTYISAGRLKVDGNETAPLSDASRARQQQLVDHAYHQFAGDVALGRRVPVASVIDGFGEGASVSSAEALRLGMIDGIGTLGQTLARLTAPPPSLALRGDRQWRQQSETRFLEWAFGRSATGGVRS